MSVLSAPASGAVARGDSAAASESGWRREFDLLVLCAGPGGESNRERIARLLESGLDWTRLLASADHHGVMPFLYQRLAESDLWRLAPPESWRLLERQFHANLKHNLLLMGQLTSLLRALDEAGIPAVAFKGPALATAMWGSLALRQCTDLDLMVQRQHARGALAVLRGLDYQVAVTLSSPVLDEHIRVASEMQFRKASPEVLLELQWDIAPRCFAVDLDMDEFWSRTTATKLGGVSTIAFAQDDLVLALCVHGWKHAWSRLIWVCDIAQLVVKSRGLDWQRLHGRARELGLERILLLGATLAHELLASPLPEALRKRAQQDADLRRLLDEALLGLSEDRVADYRDWHAFLLRARERRRDRMRHVAGFVMTPGVPELTAVSLPRPFHFLYPILRIFRLAGMARRIQLKSRETLATRSSASCSLAKRPG